MEEKDNYKLLDLMLRPAFCVKDGTIVSVNAAAQTLLIAQGSPIRSMLLTGQEEYDAFNGGCLYLQLDLSGTPWGASVTELQDTHVFLLEQEADDSSLRTMSLAARELRDPLNNLIAISDNLLPHAVSLDDPKVSELLARMSKGLYQMQRVLGNMSDAGNVPLASQQEIQNIPQVFFDIFEKAGTMLEQLGICLSYSGIDRDIFGLIDARQMERAVLNILSNALKFMDGQGHIEAQLTHRGSMLRLSIQDSGSGIGNEILGNLFSQYLRQPGIEDRRHGLGLGMVLIRNTAVSHGGTVLVDQPHGQGTRITITMKLRQNQTAHVRAFKTDLSGGRDQALIELSQFLPTSIYEKER